ncbi:MAG TPA: hypothetical protein VK427_05670 [Kofleriaceae bacterium]|nr:hypothetical protein [Kofleriaceae bacterium]
MRLAWLAALAACGGGDDGDPPLAEVNAQLSQLAVNDASLFAIDAKDSSVLELALADGKVVGKLPSTGAVSALVAHGSWVAWIETEGTGKVIRRRKTDGMLESLRAQTPSPKILASAEGLFYSDGQVVAVWPESVNPVGVALTPSAANVIGADLSYVYTVEADTSVVRYPRQGDTSEIVLPMSKDATVKDGQIAHRTSEGIRERDLVTGFDRVVGSPPADYPCQLLIAGRAVMCGKYRAMDGFVTELIDEDVTGYASVGKTVVWVKSDGKKSSIYRIDAELTE